MCVTRTTKYGLREQNFPGDQSFFTTVKNIIFFTSKALYDGRTLYFMVCQPLYLIQYEIVYIDIVSEMFVGNISTEPGHIFAHSSNYCCLTLIVIFTLWKNEKKKERQLIHDTDIAYFYGVKEERGDLTIRKKRKHSSK